MAFIISWLFRHYYHATLLGIAGLVLGSVIALWPGWQLTSTFIVGYLFCVLGGALGWMLTTYQSAK